MKAYAFVNYADIGAAVKAMQAVEGVAIPQLTGKGGRAARLGSRGRGRHRLLILLSASWPHIAQPKTAATGVPHHPSTTHTSHHPPPQPTTTGVKPLVMRYQQEGGGSTASTPKPPGSAGSGAAASLIPRVASEAAMAALGLNQLVPGSSLASLLTGGHHAATAPPTIAASATATSADGSGSDDGLIPVPNLSNK